MQPSEVPDEWMKQGRNALARHYRSHSGPHMPTLEGAARAVLAAVIPAIRQQAHTDGRAEALAQLQAGLVKLRAACTYQDELAAQYRIGLNDALDALDRIARGDQ